MQDRWTRLPKWGRWTIVVFVALVVITLLAGDEESSQQGEGGRAAETTAASETTPAQKASTSTAAAEPARPNPNRKLDRNTRKYVDTMVPCQAAAALARSIISEGEPDPVSLADSTTQARDICETTRSQLLRLETDDFDDEAAVGWHAIDRYKSGLNAVLAYLDQPRPTKVIEARDKLNEGDAATAQARQAINKKRRDNGLKSIRAK